MVKFNKRQLPEFGLMMLVLGLICQIMFMTKSPLEYVLLVPLLWAAFRMGTTPSNIRLLFDVLNNAGFVISVVKSGEGTEFLIKIPV